MLCPRKGILIFPHAGGNGRAKTSRPGPSRQFIHCVFSIWPETAFAAEDCLVDDWELFDLEKDPQELASVYNSPGYIGVVKHMKTKLKALKSQYKVPPAVNISL